jgi:hypothetical protein
VSVALARTGVGFVRLGDRISAPLLPTKILAAACRVGGDVMRRDTA